MAVINKVQLQKCFVSVFMCFSLLLVCFPSTLQDRICSCSLYVQLTYVLSLSLVTEVQNSRRREFLV